MRCKTFAEFILHGAVFVTFSTATMLSTTSNANSALPSSIELVEGKFSSSQIGNAFSANPAIPHYYQSSAVKRKTYISVTAQGSVEYGDVDDLFDLIDELSNSFANSESSTGGGSGGSDDGVDIGNNFDFDNPDLDALIDEIKNEAALTVAITALVQTEGYAKGQLEGKFSLLLKPEILNGSLKFDFSQRYFTAALGLADPLNFNANQALAELEAAYSLQPSDPETVFDLSSGIELTVNPSAQNISVQFHNDSALLTRGARINEFSVNYSSEITLSDNGKFYWGVTPKYLNVGMSNLATRLGDVADAETLFDDIRDAELETDSNFDLDLGAIWTTTNYSLGAHAINIINPEYKFSSVDTTNFTSTVMLDKLSRRQTHNAGTGLTFQGSIYTSSHSWVLSSSLDTLEVNDPLGQKFQWFSVQGDYNANRWYFPQASIGYFENLAGSKINYLSADLYFFRYLNLNLSSSLNNTTIDGDSLPRGVNIAMGLHFDF